MGTATTTLSALSSDLVRETRSFGLELARTINHAGALMLAALRISYILCQWVWMIIELTQRLDCKTAIQHVRTHVAAVAPPPCTVMKVTWLAIWFGAGIRICIRTDLVPAAVSLALTVLLLQAPFKVPPAYWSVQPLVNRLLQLQHIAKQVVTFAADFPPVQRGPGYWKSALKAGKSYTRVRLVPGNLEFQRVASAFEPAGRSILWVEYVQNPSLWARYLEEKETVGIPEVIRFHGTPYSNVDSICAHGLLASLCGGRIYSAQNPSISIPFSNKGPGPDGVLYMFMCRALTTVPNVSTFTVNAQIFPEFIIAYR
jgi:hypothetical protein